MNNEHLISDVLHRLESQEELIANLMLAYTEMSSAIETIINTVMEPKNEEEKAEFRKELQRRHIETIEVLKQVYESVENGVGESTSGDPGPSILRMAAEKQANKEV